MAILEQIGVDGNAVGMGTAGGRQGPFLVPSAPTAFELPAVPAGFHPPLPFCHCSRGQCSGMAQQGATVATMHTLGTMEARKGCGAGGTTAEGLVDGAVGAVLEAGR